MSKQKKFISQNIPENLITIGRFSKPFGIQGYVRVYSYSGESEHFKNISTILIGTDFQTSFQEYRVEDWQLNHPIRCKLSHIHTPEDAKFLGGLDIYVDRKFAIKLKQEEYYLADLEGLQVMHDGTAWGKIEGIITDCYAPLFDIKWNSGKSSYIPFIKEFFDVPNLKSKTIELLSLELKDG